ncbi:MAG: hypothetical protein ACI4XA_00405 [Oscillospiraceae bacterium]
MYCKFCGNQLCEGARFCGVCGKEQSGVETVSGNNNKAIICYLLSIFVEIIVMIAPFLSLINIEFHLTVGMWGVYSVEKTNMSLSAIGIIENVSKAQALSYMSGSFDNYFAILSGVSVMILAQVLVSAMYMVVYIACYSYDGKGKNTAVFGKNFASYSSIPSIISAILVIALMILGSRGTNEYQEYISVTPAIGSVIIILGSIAHIIINAKSKELRNVYQIPQPVRAPVNLQPVVKEKDVLGRLKSLSTERIVDRPWNCGDCGTLNSANTIKCVNCGKYKD